MGNYIPSTKAERQEMLDELGLNSLDDLYASIPDEARIKHLDIAPGMSEMEVSDAVSAIAEKNKIFKAIFRGAGAYHHYIPSIVKTVTSKEEFVTAYTPYQAEISQGVLQSIFEYQTQICELTGMEVSNASVYDGATAAAEAVVMLEDRKKSGVLVAGTVDPQVIDVVKTYAEPRGIKVHVIEPDNYKIDVNTITSALTGNNYASVLIQSPNYFGSLEDVEAITQATHELQAKVIMSANPISLGALKSPAELGADIAVGEGQPLGMPLSFGGPYLGYMATTSKLARKLPGRIVGQTEDTKGNRCFVLTLQAREQHIRREKASSNICSNQALCAMAASVYLAAVGPKGLAQVANSSAAHAHYLAQQLEHVGFQIKNKGQFFNEFLTSCPINAQKLESILAENNILGGLIIKGDILWCCTEMNTKAQIDRLVTIIKEAL